MNKIFLISLFLSFYLILSAGIDANEILVTDKSFVSKDNLKVNYVYNSLNYSNDLAVVLKSSGIKYNLQDLKDYSDAEYIPLIVKYYSPVEFGIASKVSDLSSYQSNTNTINSIKNVAISKGGSFKVSYKTIPYVALKIPRNKIKEFTSDFSNLGIKISDIYVDSHVSALLNDTTKIIRSDVCTGSVQECTIYTGQTDCTSHGCLWKNGGSGVTIAIIDSGVDKTHPDLDDLDDNPNTYDPKVIGEKCFCDVGSSCCPNGQTIDDSAPDLYGHGTHCTAIAAGTGKASNYKFVGVAPKAKILAVKVLNNNGVGTSSDIISGIEWAVQNGANIISMSLGTNPGIRDLPMEDAVRQAINQGVVVVIAAGNSGPETNTIASPGVVAEAITVGASQKDAVSAPYSSRGPADYILKPDVFAPGGNADREKCGCLCSLECCSYPQGIFSAIPLNSNLWNNCGSYCKDFTSDYYMRISGTSMATPHVAGAAAILKQIHPGWTPAQIKSALVLAAVPVIKEKAASCRGIPHDCSAHSGDANNDGKIDPSDVFDCTQSGCFSSGLPNNLCYGIHWPCNSYTDINICMQHGCSWAVNPTYEDAGRIDVFESLNVSITTDPSVFNMGAVGTGATSIGKTLTITNSGKTRQGVRLVKDPNFDMQFSNNDFCLYPGNNIAVTITINTGSLPFQYYTGRLKIVTSPKCNFGVNEKTYYLPFSFLKMKEVKITFDIEQFFTPEYVSWFWRIRNKDGTFDSVDLTQIDTNTYHFYTVNEEFDLFGFVEQKDGISPTNEKYNYFVRPVDLRGTNSLDLYLSTDNVNRLNSNVASVINSKNMELWFNEIDFSAGKGTIPLVFYSYNMIPLENIILGVDIPSNTYFNDYAINVKPIAVEDVNLWYWGSGGKILILPVEFSYPFSKLDDNVLDYQIKNSNLIFYNSVKHDKGFKIGFYPYSTDQDLSFLDYMSYTNISLPWSYDLSFRDNSACHNCKYLIRIAPYSTDQDVNIYVDSWNGQSDIYQSGTIPSEITFFEKPFDFYLNLYGSSINGYLADYIQINKKLNVKTSTVPLKITDPYGSIKNIYADSSLSWSGYICQDPCPTGNYRVDFDSSDIITGIRIFVTANINYDGSSFSITSVQKNYQTDPCTGSIIFSSFPGSAYTYSYIYASIEGLTNCYYKNIYIKKDSCTNSNIACTIPFRQHCESDVCGCSFSAPATPGTYNYYSCIDKDNDGDFVDSGETAVKTITVITSTTMPGMGGGMRGRPLMIDLTSFIRDIIDKVFGFKK